MLEEPSDVCSLPARGVTLLACGSLKPVPQDDARKISSTRTAAAAMMAMGTLLSDVQKLSDLSKRDSVGFVPTGALMGELEASITSKPWGFP